MTVLSYAARNNQAGTCVCTSAGVIVLLWNKQQGMAPGMVVMILDENQSWPDYAVAQPHAGLPLPVSGLLTALQKKTGLPQPDGDAFRTAKKYSSRK